MILDRTRLLALLAFGVPALDVRIEGEPKGKDRPRATRTGRVYTPQQTVQWERHAAAAYRLQWRGPPIPDPVVVDVEAVLPRPKRLGDEPGRMVATRKPDVDNVGKIVLDAMHGVVIDDDADVISLHTSKAYAGLGEAPHVRVRVWAWKEAR